MNSYGTLGKLYRDYLGKYLSEFAHSLFSASVKEAYKSKIFAILHRVADILVCEVGGIFVHITARSSGTEQSNVIQCIAVCYCVILVGNFGKFITPVFWKVLLTF